MNNYSNPIRGRQLPSQNGPAKSMEAGKLDKMKQESMAFIEVEFHNSPGARRFWSKCGQKKHRNINDAINHLMWLVTGYKKWAGCVHRAAIFDARIHKNSSAANKIYQYENNCWKLEASVSL